MIGVLKRSLRPVLCFAAFALAFAAACGAIQRALPLQNIPAVWQKLAHLSARGGDYDTIFIGSSRIYYQIVPRIFDELSAARGLPTRSFNAGIAGMRPPEDAFVFDQILAARLGKLRWVFVELAGIRMNIGDERRGTLRMQYWHDLPRTALLWRYATQLPESKKRWTPKRLWRQLREPLGDFLPHLELFLREQTNIGKGGELITKIERTGATPVLIVPPTTSKKNFFPLPGRERGTIILDFSDPARFPELYEVRHRLDSEHTNTAGSEVFTRLLAERWAEAVKASANQ
jgi:hypothetical protein